MRRPLLSVLLPYRDAASTLPQAVDSLLMERDIDLEVLAIDDGSHDGGAEWVRRRATSDPRLRPMVNHGRGLARALETVRREARGRFIGRMDADDVSLPGRLRASIERLLQEPSLALVAVQVAATPPAAATLGLLRYVAWQNGLLEPEEHLRERFVEAPVCHPAVVMRRDALERVGGYRDGPFPEDYELWLRMLSAGLRFAKVPRILLHWRHVANRATFRDPRCSPSAIRHLKAAHLARWIGARRWVMWGAGPTGRKLADALAARGRRPDRFVDVAAERSRHEVRGLPVRSPASLRPGRECVVVAVGLPSVRPLIRKTLRDIGFQEPLDAIFAA